MCIYINKSILKNNLEIISKKFNKIPTFVLKSDAYGLGIKNIFPILLEAYGELVNKYNYDSLLQVFVRDIKEAILVRKIYNKYENMAPINIIILNSIEKKHINLYKKHDLIPLINNLSDMENFKDFFITHKVILNIDVGMNRTGIKYNLIEENLPLLKKFDLIGIMSHLHITKDLIIDKINHLEKDRFEKIINYFFHIKNITFASSNVLDYGEDFIYSQPRIGKALYGLCHKDYGLEEAISFKFTVSQVNKVYAGEIVGYNGYKILKDGYIGVFNVGYAHGLSLNFVNNMEVAYKNNSYKIISISMEYMMVDFKNIKIKTGEKVQLFSNGFIKDMIKDTYYLEQLLRFSLMDKKIINN